MNKSVILGILVVLVAGGSYVFLNKDTVKAPVTKSTSSTSNELTKIAATIVYSSTGFSPSITTVKDGDIVAVNNTSSGDLQMESDPHPAHTDDTDLNVGLVSAGETKNFTVTKTGTFGFHNHLNSSDTAKIVIE